MRMLAAILAVFLLVSCGVDGEPDPVGDSGMRLSGEAKIGVRGRR